MFAHLGERCGCYASTMLIKSDVGLLVAQTHTETHNMNGDVLVREAFYQAGSTKTAEMVLSLCVLMRRRRSERSVSRT